MADGEVVYEVRADDSKLDGDLNKANSKIEGQTSKIAGIAKTAGVAIAGTVFSASAAAVKFGSEFETAMAGASTLFGDVNVDVDNLNAKMLELSTKTGVDATELGQTLYDALSSGIAPTEDMGDALSFLEKSTSLAKAGFTDINTAMSTTVTTLNAYGMGVDQTDRIQKILMQTQNKGITTVDELGASLAQVTPTAAAFGVSFENVGAALATMTAMGTPTAQATTQLNSVIAELGKNGTAAQKNLMAAAQGSKYAGMSFSEMMASGASLNDVLNLMGGYAEGNNLSMVDMFSSIEAGKAALSIAGDNSQLFNDNLASMSTNADVVGEALEKISDTSGEKFNKIMNEMKNMAIELFISMAPLLEEALPVLTTLMESLLPPIMELAESLMPLLVELFDAIAVHLGEMIETLMPPLIDLFNQIIPPLSELIKQIMPILVELFNTLLPPIMELVSALLPPLIEVFNALMPPIQELI